MSAKISSLEHKPMSLRQQQPNPEEKVRDVAKLYEKQFLREMVAAMRKTVDNSGLVRENMAEKIFRDKLDQEYVESWGDKGGIGMADLIYEQMIERYGAQMGIKTKVQKPMGPMPLAQQKDFRVYQMRNEARGVKALSADDVLPAYKMQGQVPDKESMTSSPKPISQSYLFKRLENVTLGSSAQITAPWSGHIQGEYQLEDGRKVLAIEHDNGLRSQFLFTGQIFQDASRDRKIEAGQTVGVLSPESGSVLWKVTGPAQSTEAVETPD